MKNTAFSNDDGVSTPKTPALYSRASSARLITSACLTDTPTPSSRNFRAMQSLVPLSPAKRESFSSRKLGTNGLTVYTPTVKSREFICNVTSCVRVLRRELGKDGVCGETASAFVLTLGMER